MSTDIETNKRLEIISAFTKELEQATLGVLIGGSMGFGQFFSVTEKSDIDAVVVCRRENLDQLLETSIFKNNVPKPVAELFRTHQINFFWLITEINGIEVNFFVYEKCAYVDFCLLKGILKGYIPFEPAKTQTAYGFDGSKITFNRNVKPFGKGFLFEKPSLVKGKYWGGVPRQDFFYSSYVAYEENYFFRDLEEKVWTKTIKKLQQEAGENLDLKKFNILNTHYTYQTEKKRLPKIVIEHIQKRTLKELGN